MSNFEDELEENQAIVFCLGIIDYTDKQEPFVIQGISTRFNKGFLDTCVQFNDSKGRNIACLPLKTASISDKKQAKFLKKIILKEIELIFDNLNEKVNPNDIEDSVDFITDP
jgi:hypothetical protein